MKVSVIIPAYNTENYISRCLDSIINQVYKNLEIIVVDDASVDNTKQIIKEYAEKDSRIIPFYSSINKGVSVSRNIGLRASTGDYIIFVDSDDELTKDAIRRLIDVSNKYNSDYVDSYQLLVYNKKNKLVSFTEHRVPKKVLVLGSLNENTKILDMNSYIKGKLIKRDLIKDLEFDESLDKYEDLVFDHKLKTRVKNYVFLNKVIYIYYQRKDSIQNKFGKEHTSYLDAAKKLKEIYKDYNKDVKDKIDAIVFQNMILTLFSKVIKNDEDIDKNLIITKNCLKDLINLVPDFKDNKYINIFIKKIAKYNDNDKKLCKLIKIFQKKNLVKFYFGYLSILNRYEIKNPLL